MRKKNIDSVVTVPKLYSIKDVHKLFETWNEKYGKNMRVRHKKHIVEEFDGHLVKTWSQRYELFPTNTTCVCCGLQAKYYKLQKQTHAKYFHFNLYGVKDGNEVLFTKDHITPKSKGGKNSLDNYQVMCATCNQKKGDKVLYE